MKSFSTATSTTIFPHPSQNISAMSVHLPDFIIPTHFSLHQSAHSRYYLLCILHMWLPPLPPFCNISIVPVLLTQLFSMSTVCSLPPEPSEIILCSRMMLRMRIMKECNVSDQPSPNNNNDTTMTMTLNASTTTRNSYFYSCSVLLQRSSPISNVVFLPSPKNP